MDIICLDDNGCLFLSPKIEHWDPVAEYGITVVIDLEGGLDHCIPTMPNHILYLYYPIYDEDLPDMHKLQAVARLCASMVEAGHKVLSHCGMGFNRSALVAGLIMHKLGMPGRSVVERIRERRAGALFNENFARFLEEL